MKKVASYSGRRAVATAVGGVRGLTPSAAAAGLGFVAAGPPGMVGAVAAGAVAAGAGASVKGSNTVFAWALLALTILLEVSGTTCMKLSNGFERVVPSIFVFVSYLACFTCLTYAMKFWQVSTAYALWSGLGTALTAVIGVVVFKEPIGTIKFTSLTLIVLGVVGLNLSGR